MIKLVRLRGNQEGTAAIQMAIALPVLFSIIYGIFQLGVAGLAIAGMQHGLGEAARMGTVCLNPTATGACSQPTDEAIEDAVEPSAFGLNIGTFDDPVVSTPDASLCTNCRDITLTFHMPMNFLLFQGPTVNLTQSKRIYLAT